MFFSGRVTFYMQEYCKHGLERPRLLGMLQALQFFLSFFWQYFCTLFIHIHLDSLPVENLAL